MVIGTSADNALAESFNAALKREILQGPGDVRQSVGVSPGGVSMVRTVQHGSPAVLVRVSHT